MDRCDGNADEFSGNPIDSHSAQDGMVSACKVPRIPKREIIPRASITHKRELTEEMVDAAETEIASQPNAASRTTITVNVMLFINC